MNNDIHITIKKRVFNDAFYPYLKDDHRYLIFHGGAGSGKSVFAAQRYVYKMLTQKQFNLLVVRNTGKTNRDSTYALFKQVLIKWKLYNYFKRLEKNMTKLTISSARNKIPLPLFSGTLLYILDFFFKLF